MIDLLMIVGFIAVWIAAFPYMFSGFNRACDAYEDWCARIVDGPSKAPPDEASPDRLATLKPTDASLTPGSPK